MSIFTGPQFKGAMRDHKSSRRDEAKERDGRTPVLFLACGHKTSLPADKHLARCGGAA